MQACLPRLTSGCGTKQNSTECSRRNMGRSSRSSSPPTERMLFTSRKETCSGCGSAKVRSCAQLVPAFFCRSALCHAPMLAPSLVPGLSVLLYCAVRWPVHSHSGARALEIHRVHHVRAVLHARVHGLSRVVDVHGHPHGESHWLAWLPPQPPARSMTAD